MVRSFSKTGDTIVQQGHGLPRTDMVFIERDNNRRTGLRIALRQRVLPGIPVTGEESTDEVVGYRVPEGMWRTHEHPGEED